ncbi:hypothetical protein B9G69_002945 [Bdellovibrio sp. SKB1291214]|uniref:hypothetical protein n=1 Tax=Bdellovibrio sp. SKB1291214 TaxID=1732569 RepID=UPI000B51D634|nr:hypothetical protein [Bdellovibrio sp. SKB1291214]UYL09529.1 hypothetical protein B9G69_002945 [Bdellovibrio sp. SKB1291214]
MKAILLMLVTFGTALSASAGSIVLETNNYLNPIPGRGTSCTAMNAGREKDLSAPHISINELFVTNNSNMNFYPTRLTFTTGDTGYACTYTGQVLSDLGLEANIQPGQRAQTFCNMKCGAVPFTHHPKPGYLTVYGHYSNGETASATAEIEMMN